MSYFLYNNKKIKSNIYIKSPNFLKNNKVKKTKKTRLILFLYSFLPLLYNLITFLKICKKISFWIQSYGNNKIRPRGLNRRRLRKLRYKEVPFVYKQFRELLIKMYTYKLNMLTKSLNINLNNSILSKKKQIKFFYILKQVINFSYKVNLKEFITFGIDIDSSNKAYKKLSSNKKTLLHNYKHGKKKKQMLFYFGRAQKGGLSRKKRRPYFKKRKKKKKKKYSMKIKLTLSSKWLKRWLLHLFFKNIYFKKDKRRFGLINRHSYGRYKIRNKRRKKRRVKKKEEERYVKLDNKYFFERYPNIFYLNLEYNSFLKYSYNLTLDHFIKICKEESPTRHFNFFYFLDRTLKYWLNDLLFINDLRKRVLINSNNYLIGRSNSYRVSNIGDFIEFRYKKTKDLNYFNTLSFFFFNLLNVLYCMNGFLFQLLKNKIKKKIYKLCLISLKRKIRTLKKMKLNKLRLSNFFFIYNKFKNSRINNRIHKRYNDQLLIKKRLFFYNLKRSFLVMNTIRSPKYDNFLILSFNNNNYYNNLFFYNNSIKELYN